ncbi:ABC transporter permease [Clostridium cellulovorans]|uniref:ABC-2 type transporter n=1 Tax=Clostridium cellulovorans (strain ATCC 35296 / DSM 3052 / OCM 3 / 743B) TaxID=573061 RepID=D9SS40_CLOC7|nr:ABC transporter permease [Clostridium cellulovorans]ADL52487.1 ABC-2 type transporter [Clostridium cellulovorans 743B]
MIRIMKNVTKILFQRKSFLITTFLLPIVLIFAFTAMNNSFTTLKVAVINNDSGELGKAVKDKLSNLDGITIENTESEDYIQDLVYHQFEMVVTIDEDFTNDIINGQKSEITYETISNNDTEYIVKSVLESEVSALAKLCNNIDVKAEGIDNVIKTFRDSQPEYQIINKKDIKPSINTSLGMIFYLLFLTAGVSCGFILEDERQGTKERTLMGKISARQYYAGQCAIFFLFTAIPSIEYYAICKIFDYEFGFNNTILLLVLALLMSLLAVAFSVMMASIIKNKAVFTLINSTFTVPIFMLSGAFWPYEIMSEELQRIADAFPPRWIYMAVERLQSGEAVTAILPIVGGIILLSILFLLLSVFFTKNKIVLVKENG